MTLDDNNDDLLTMKELAKIYSLSKSRVSYIVRYSQVPFKLFRPLNSTSKRLLYGIKLEDFDKAKKDKHFFRRYVKNGVRYVRSIGAHQKYLSSLIDTRME